MEDTSDYQVQASSVPQPLQYQLSPPLLQALDWLLSNPSVPLQLRRQFYVLWENVIFGNYTEHDIKYLMSKFREWCILVKWYIPEQQWGNILSYQDPDEAGGEISIQMDLNILLNTLEQLYYINLTRGKEGFTVKEMTTTRLFQSSRYEEELKMKKRRIF